jgi:hypothetical protein
MQTEDIKRLKEIAKTSTLQKIEEEQHRLLSELKLTIKRQTIIPSSNYNDVLKQAIKLLKE